MSKEIRCPSCGEKCFDTDKFCKNCHASIDSENIHDDSKIEGIDYELWKKFIGDKSAPYLRVFEKHDGEKFFLSFNPFAFLFQSAWFYYRKMYFQGFILEFFRFIWAIFVVALPRIAFGEYYGIAFLCVFFVPFVISFPLAVGFIAPMIYRNHIKHHLTKTNDMLRGGTSLASAVWLSVLEYFLNGLIIEPLATIVVAILILPFA